MNNSEVAEVEWVIMSSPTEGDRNLYFCGDGTWTSELGAAKKYTRNIMRISEVTENMEPPFSDYLKPQLVGLERIEEDEE